MHARLQLPDAVTRSVRVRVIPAGNAGTGGLARAVAVLGEDVPLRHAAALSGLEMSRASRAADALASVEVLLGREPLRFVHPLVRHSVTQDIPASELAGRHLEAARLLDSEHAEAERVAAHLLMGRAQGDVWVVDRLRVAAQDASSRAAPHSAVRYLERALAEPPASEVRGEVLAELGAAEAALSLPAAVAHLAEAAEHTPDARRRAELARRRGNALHAQGAHEDAAEAFEEGLAELGDPAAGPGRSELRPAVFRRALWPPAR